jgi:hypothetical protein
VTFERARNHFEFTPLQTILINKRMPKGFKIESEENMLKVVENIRPITKKQKTSVRIDFIFNFTLFCNKILFF